jgi:hypothetical protein
MGERIGEFSPAGKCDGGAAGLETKEAQPSRATGLTVNRTSRAFPGAGNPVQKKLTPAYRFNRRDGFKRPRYPDRRIWRASHQACLHASGTLVTMPTSIGQFNRIRAFLKEKLGLENRAILG